MDLNDFRVHIDGRLDKIENKLDGHLDRISTAETHVSWLKGHAHIVTTIIIAAAGFFAVAFLTKGIPQ